MKNILITILAVLVISLAATTICHAADSPPNVVLIFADDLGYGDVGCYGATKVQTPNIDRLAAEGRRFTDAHSASAVCTPSRYALLTGEYPVRGNRGRGVWGPAPVTSPLIVNTEKTTIADVFKNRGYDTAVVGKWHLGFGNDRNTWKEPLRPGPLDLGFDYYFGMPVVNSAPPYVYVENDRVVGGDPDDPLVYQQIVEIACPEPLGGVVHLGVEGAVVGGAFDLVQRAHRNGLTSCRSEVCGMSQYALTDTTSSRTSWSRRSRRTRSRIATVSVT